MHLHTPRDIGAAIREGRRRLGLDQGALAEKVGVSRLWINQVERGKPGASLGLVLRALAAVGVELVADAGEGRPKAAEAVVTPDIDAIVESARSAKKR
ncbi:MAG: helix-turn-helix domain-containing protein [Kiloniellales bacterium]